MSKRSVIFVQRRAGKSGAPVALARLLAQPQMLALNPVLVTSNEGWLTEQCRQNGVPCIIQRFPSSRSLMARLFKNHLFVRRIRKKMQNKNLKASLVIGNDHLEGILTHGLGKALHVATGIFLRSSETNKRVFFKYQCHRLDLVYAVGKKLRDQARAWSPSSNVKILYDGLTENDFLPVKPKPMSFPQKILVVGSESHYKGWQDFAAAIDIAEKDPDFPSVEFHFTGKQPDPALNDMQLDKPRRCAFKFIGRVEKFRELIREYDLVIHPSREETFGLAMVETLAAGVPLLCSRVGIIEKIQKNSDFLFNSRDPLDQAKKILHLWKNWHKIDFDLETRQDVIREHFMLSDIVTSLVDDFTNLM